MNERPILFRPSLVRAILDGDKTQTRRVMKPQPAPMDIDTFAYAWPGEEFRMDAGPADWWLSSVPRGTDDDAAQMWPTWDKAITCPYGAAGDRLWVREKVTLVRGHGERADLYGPEEATLRYADGETRRVPVPKEDRSFPWKRLTRPGIHMPRWACRVVLEVTKVRLQRLQTTKQPDAWAEGTWTEFAKECAQKGWAFDPVTNGEPLRVFRESWDRINGERGFGWDVNPWVWAITFRQVAP